MPIKGIEMHAHLKAPSIKTSDSLSLNGKFVTTLSSSIVQYHIVVIFVK